MKKPELVGIVNLTPDSFSGDGQLDRDALAHAAQLAAEGADILDIGAESTRPGATAISAGEEWARLAPFLEAARVQAWRANIKLSIDTYHAATAEKALQAGVEMINDVGGLRDPAMAEVLRGGTGDIVVMHALSLPASAATVWPPETDVIAAILEWKNVVTQKASDAGIAVGRLIFDPGLGFGKTPEQSLRLVLRASQLVESGGRWYYGHSRKSFLKLFEGETDRDALTLAFSVQLVEAGVNFIRVHAVARHRAMLEDLCM